MELLKNAGPDFIAFNYYCTATVSGSQEKLGNQAGDQQIAIGEAGFYNGESNEYLEKLNLAGKLTRSVFGLRSVLFTSDTICLLLSQKMGWVPMTR